MSVPSCFTCSPSSSLPSYAYSGVHLLLLLLFLLFLLLLPPPPPFHHFRFFFFFFFFLLLLLIIIIIIIIIIVIVVNIDSNIVIVINININIMFLFLRIPLVLLYPGYVLTTKTPFSIQFQSPFLGCTHTELNMGTRSLHSTRSVIELAYQMMVEYRSIANDTGNYMYVTK